MAKGFPSMCGVNGESALGQGNTNGDNILCKVCSGLGNQRFTQDAKKLDKACLVAKKVGKKRSAYRVFSRAANEGEFLLSRNALGKNVKKLLASVGLAGEQLGDGEGATSGSGNTLRDAL